MINFIKKYCMTKHKTALILTIIVLILTGCEMKTTAKDNEVSNDSCELQPHESVAWARHKYRKEISEGFDKCVTQVSRNPASDKKLSAAVEECKTSVLEIYGADNAGWINISNSRSEIKLRRCGYIKD